MLTVKEHRSRFWASEVVRVEVDDTEPKQAIVVYYLASQNCVVVDLVTEDDPVYERLHRFDLTPLTQETS